MGQPLILLVDDDPAMRALERIMLEEQGLECREAANGVEALSVFEHAGPFAAIVLDFRMPDLTGIEVAERLRADGVDVPIVLYTGFARPEVVAHREHLQLDVVDKSDPESMVATVQRYVAAR